MTDVHRAPPPFGTGRVAAPFDLDGARVWVAGHTGMVGSAIVRRLASEPVTLITAPSTEVDLRDQAATHAFVISQQPDVAIIAAARVGGIGANQAAQGTFLFENLMIAANTIEACRLAGVRKVVMLGSSCIYPRDAAQPIVEDALLTGPLEATNEGYAVAKIAALTLGSMYRRQHGLDCISVMPCNLYGPNDSFDLGQGHVMAALLRKVHEAKVNGASSIEVWGTGTPRREFMHADDLADATVHLLRWYSGERHVNVGTGVDLTIRDLAVLIGEVVGWDGVLQLDLSKPDGTPRKLLDVSRLRTLGWDAARPLRDGLLDTYRWYVTHGPGAD
jgi:GDP-L-fucose synthase